MINQIENVLDKNWLLNEASYGITDGLHDNLFDKFHKFYDRSGKLNRQRGLLCPDSTAEDHKLQTVMYDLA